MTAASRVLDRLEPVRETGPRRWTARCPAHEDRSPSLSVREGDDGRVLLYCFAGCGAIEVLAALGLDWSALYPEQADRTNQLRSHRRGGAPRIPARDALALLDQEALVVEVIAHRLAEGELPGDHLADLGLAAGRIAAVRAALEVAP